MTIMTKQLRNSIFAMMCILIHTSAFSQESETTEDPLNLGVRLEVTTNGFSYVPAFSLGKPASVINLSLEWKRFSFEPQIRNSLELKPWSYIFSFRYKLITGNKFQTIIGAQLPSMVFTETTNVSGNNSLVANRFIVGELITNYSISPKISLGTTYFYSRGVQDDTFQHGHYFAFSTNFSNIKLSRQFQFNFTPQLFYLKLDENDGTYFAANINFEKVNFPISIGASMYSSFKTDISGNDFDWNVSLVYSFNKKFVNK